MSDKLGPMTFGDTEETIFLGREITTERNYSDSTAEEIDSEARKFIDSAYEAARAAIKKHTKALEDVR
jgi:cell division protease FtsH